MKKLTIDPFFAIGYLIGRVKEHISMDPKYDERVIDLNLAINLLEQLKEQVGEYENVDEIK